MYSGTRHRRYANGQNLSFSAHTEHSAAQFSLIASGCRSFTSPRDATEITRHRHLETSASTSFHEKNLSLLLPFPPCLHQNQEKKRKRKVISLMYATQINKDYKQMCAIVCILGAWICICWAFKQRHKGRPNLLSAQPLFSLLWKPCSLNNHTSLWQ